MEINIILADDHHVIREGLRLLLDREKDLFVLAEADTEGRHCQQLKDLNRIL